MVFIPFQFSSFSGFQLFLSKATVTKSSAVTFLKNEYCPTNIFCLNEKIYGPILGQRILPKKIRFLCDHDSSDLSNA